MELIDLHTHSTASDGSDTPSQLVARASDAGLRALALTDHDTMAGLEEAEEAAKAKHIEFARGCEISTMTERGEIHILGLWTPRRCQELEDYLALLRNRRLRRNDRIIALLQAQGLNITHENAARHARGAMGRPHIAAAMVDKGYVENIREAFDIWLGRGGRAYVPKTVPQPAEAVRLLAKNGASPVIAHPLLHPAPPGWLKQFAASLVPHGLFGLEAWHSSHSPGQTQEVLETAVMLNLGVSGGSDYHGRVKPDIQLGSGRGNLRIGRNVLENLKKRRRAMGLPVEWTSRT